jgi:protein gp37
MGARTEISWCDCTFNPWLGCTKVSPACDGCYAEAMMDLRYGRVEWGAPGKGNGTRVRTSAANWKLPIKWNKEAGVAGTRPRVFCASLADVFDNQVPPEWREDLFELIAATPNLVWLLLTKRPQNIVKMVCESGAIAGNGTRYLPRNAALGTTCEDQERADRNLTELLRAAVETGPLFTFGSFEPLLGPVDISLFLRTVPALGWVIAGGETDQGKHKARPSHPYWFRSLLNQCTQTGTPFHLKQRGEYTWIDDADYYDDRIPELPDNWRERTDDKYLCIRADGSKADGYGGDSAEFLYRVGKKSAGRRLDGREHNGFPEIANATVPA